MLIKDIIKIGLWLDDPYGDGIRLEAIRKPRMARIVALNYKEELANDRVVNLIMEDYAPRVKAAMADKHMRKSIKINLGI